jgi:Fe2+ transport system protein FeoA
MLQLSVNKPKTLAQLKQGEPGTLDRLDLTDDVARRLMELGFLPSYVIVTARRAPGGAQQLYGTPMPDAANRPAAASRLILREAQEAMES